MRFRCDLEPTCTLPAVIEGWERAGLILAADLAMVGHVGRCIERLSSPGRVTLNVSMHSVECGAMEYLAAASSLLDSLEVVVEITETHPCSDVRLLRNFASSARAMGFHLALDDASPAHLYGQRQNLELIRPDYVKLDGNFVVAALHSTLVRAQLVELVHAAHGVGAPVIAEWIESEALLDMALNCGADLLQGHLIARPEVFNPLGCLSRQPAHR